MEIRVSSPAIKMTVQVAGAAKVVVSRWRVDVEASHMHGLVARFHPQEGGVRGTECLHGLASFTVD